jgi:type VI protein secretion system component VasK
MNRVMFVSIAALGLFVWPDAAMAYVGPGAGISLIGALVGLVAAVFTALGVVLSWPIRKILKRSRAAKQANEDTPAATNASAEDVDNPETS